nr:recombinase family protein [Vibrio sp. 10N.286.48.B7]PMH78504.1 hypothetical protein BCU58_09010 [Vibrio sp. 10N.286.48.B7]
MAIYAYIRVSDAQKQNSSTQRHVISEYATERNMTISKWYEFELSGSKTNTGERGIESLLAQLEPGDKVLVSDIARLGRDNIHSLMHTITTITTEGAELHFCLSNTTITHEDENDLAKMFMALGEAYAAVKFAEERSLKAKAVCKRRKEKGLHNGRKPGAVVRSKLDQHVALIKDRLDAKVPKAKIILELKDKHDCDVARSRFYSWLTQRGLS